MIWDKEESMRVSRWREVFARLDSREVIYWLN